MLPDHQTDLVTNTGILLERIIISWFMTERDCEFRLSGIRECVFGRTEILDLNYMYCTYVRRTVTLYT